MPDYSSQKDSQKAENCLLDRLDVEENSIGQWIHYLNVVASVAPMIGLLGTVSGMISAFQTLDAEGWGGLNYWLAILVKLS